MREWFAGRMKPGHDSGMTLVELLVASVMLSIVLGFVYGLLGSVQKQSVDLQGREESVGNTRLALEQMDRQIRSGNVLYDPQLESLPMSMRIYTQSNGNLRCVQWQVYNGALRSRSWSPTWQTDGLVTPWGNVARDIVNTLATPPFRLDTTTGVGSRLVDISLRVKDPSARGNVLLVPTSLSGRNSLYGYDTGVCNPVPAA